MNTPISQGMGRSASAAREQIEVPGASLALVHRPAQIAELSTLLAERHAQGAGVLICGGRTRLGFANRARPLSAALSLEALAGIDVFDSSVGSDLRKQGHEY